MNEDLRDLLRCLKSHSVDFMIVGSHVLALYARARFTEDLDLWVRATSENALALARALRDFGFPVTDEQVLKLSSGRNMLRMGTPPNQVDILGFLGSREAPMDFGSAFERSVESNLLGVPVPFLSKEDFVHAKKASGRPRDVSDLAELEGQ